MQFEAARPTFSFALKLQRLGHVHWQARAPYDHPNIADDDLLLFLTCPTSEVRLGRHFASNFHISSGHADRVVNGSRETKRGEKPRSPPLLPLYDPRKRLHSFVSQGCGELYM
jgi:hypothetical protein